MQLPADEIEILTLMSAGKAMIEYAGVPFGRGYTIEGRWFSAKIVHELEHRGLIRGIGHHNFGETFEITDLGRALIAAEVDGSD